MPTATGSNEIKLNPATLKAVFAAWLSDTMKGGPFEVTNYELEDDDMVLAFQPTKTSGATP